jgi:twin arginine-targeting protein translocase, TatA/E family
LQTLDYCTSGGFMLGKLGLPELLVLLAIVFFLFGAKRLPEIGKGIGEGIKGFKDAMRKDEKDLQETKQKEV